MQNATPLDHNSTDDPWAQARSSSTASQEPPPPKGGGLWLEAPDGVMPLSIQIEDGGRPASEAELGAYLRAAPWHCDALDPALLRRALPGADGEFLALIAELARLKRSGFDAETAGYSDENQAKIDAALAAVCAAPIAGATGAAMKLHFMLNEGRVSAFSAVRQRQLATAASTWLWHHVEGRPVDCSDLALTLEAMAKGEEDHDARLLALVAEYQEVHRKGDRDRTDDEADALGVRAGELEEEIAALPARSGAGAVAKAAALRLKASEFDFADELFESTLDDLERFAA